MGKAAKKGVTPNPNPVAGELAEKACRDYPSTPTRTLARMLHRDHPEVFRTIENARKRVLYYRGSLGKFCRKVIDKDRLCASNSPTTPYNMPASDAECYEPVPFPFEGRGALLSDLHIPYHDMLAMELALDYCIEKGYTDWCWINGDLIDCYQMSRWEKDPRKRNIKEEIDATRQMLKVLCEMFGKVGFKLGNHDARFEKYLMQNAPALVGVEGTTLAEQLHLGEMGIPWVDEGMVVAAGGLTILHGHEYGRSVFNPVNPARGAFLRSKASVVIGHNHQTSEHGESNIQQKHTTCWSLGCLCDLHPQYSRINKWNHGFGTMIYEKKSGWFEVDTHKIIDGRVA